MKMLLILMLAAIAVNLGLAGKSHAAETPKAEEKRLDSGSVLVYEFDGLKLHVYLTGDAMSDACFILETGKNLVAIESPAFEDNLSAWKKYASGLEKPLTDILISYHPAGGGWYGSAVSHATGSAARAISQGATKNLTESLGKAFGPAFSTDIPAIDKIIPAGKVNIGGIDFVITDNGDGYDIAIPAANAVYIHMLGAVSHSILAAPAHMEAYAATLEGIRSAGYGIILSSHHAPETQADVAAKIAYVKKAGEIAAQSKSGEDFKKRMQAAFPGFGGLNYLDMSAGFLFAE